MDDLFWKSKIHRGSIKRTAVKIQKTKQTQNKEFGS